MNRAQFTSVLDDEDYKAALAHADERQRMLYQQEARQINEIQKGILAISGQEKPFDVFLCYKETDETGARTPNSVLANDLYHLLTQAGKEAAYTHRYMRCGCVACRTHDLAHSNCAGACVSKRQYPACTG